MDDIELLRLYVEEDSEQAFAELVHRHVDLVYSAALRQVYGDTHRAHDVAQDVFADLARKAPSLLAHTALVGWLYTSARFSAARMNRTEKRRELREVKAHALQEETLPLEMTDEDWNQLRPLLDEAMHELGERDREILLLRYFEKESYPEIGRKIGLNENATRMSVERALEKLRRILAHRGVTSTSAALGLVLTHQAVIAAPIGLGASITASALSATTVAPALALMTTTQKALLGLLVLTGVPAVGTAIYEFRHAARIEAESLQIRGENARMESHMQELQAQTQTLETARQQASVQRAPTPPPVRPATAANREQDAYANGRKFLAEFPAVRALLMDISKAQTARTFGPFYRMAQLGPSEIATFEQKMGELMLEHMTLTPDALTPVMKGPLETSLQGILSETASQQLREFTRSMGAYGLALKVATVAANTDTIFSMEQADRLAQTVLKYNPAYQRGQPANPVQADWAAILAEAGGYLSAAQMRSVEAVVLPLQYRVALNQAMSAAQRTATPSPE